MKTVTPGAGRIIGVDLARCLALIAMYVAHVAPSAGPAGILNLSEFVTAPPLRAADGRISLPLHRTHELPGTLCLIGGPRNRVDSYWAIY